MTDRRNRTALVSALARVGDAEAAFADAAIEMHLAGLGDDPAARLLEIRRLTTDMLADDAVASQPQPSPKVLRRG